MPEVVVHREKPIVSCFLVEAELEQIIESHMLEFTC